MGTIEIEDICICKSNQSKVMNSLRELIRKHVRLHQILRAARFVLISAVTRVNGTSHKYPKVLQLPLTYRCNSKCRMCDIWRKDHSDEMSVEEFGRFIKDDIFREVVGVGVNGGEPSLIVNLPRYVEKILALPKLKSLNVISNGFLQHHFLNSLEEIHSLCRAKGVGFHVAISLDGVGLVHDRVRNSPKAFERTIATVDAILSQKARYCDSFDVACTIVQQNVDGLLELDAFAKIKGYEITYRLGVENQRIGSDKMPEVYSVLCNPKMRQAAKEFVHFKFFEARNFYDKFKYFSIFYWMNSSSPRRLMGCAWQNEGVTMDARGDLYYCAVASDKLGGLRHSTGRDVFFSDKNLSHRERILTEKCDNCIHDYGGVPQLKNLAIFFAEILRNRFSMKIYYLKCRLGLI